MASAPWLRRPAPSHLNPPGQAAPCSSLRPLPPHPWPPSLLPFPLLPPCPLWLLRTRDPIQSPGWESHPPAQPPSVTSTSLRSCAQVHGASSPSPPPLHLPSLPLPGQPPPGPALLSHRALCLMGFGHCRGLCPSSRKWSLNSEKATAVINSQISGAFRHSTRLTTQHSWGRVLCPLPQPTLRPEPPAVPWAFEVSRGSQNEIILDLRTGVLRL